MIQNRIRKKQLDYTWPGFVDALSSLLMVIIFVLMIFVISQFFISQKMSGQDEALIKLKNNLTELSELLSLERGTTTELTEQLSILEEKFTVIKEDLIKEKAKPKGKKWVLLKVLSVVQLKLQVIFVSQRIGVQEVKLQAHGLMYFNKYTVVIVMNISLLILGKDGTVLLIKKPKKNGC